MELVYSRRVYPADRNDDDCCCCWCWCCCCESAGTPLMSVPNDGDGRTGSNAVPNPARNARRIDKGSALASNATQSWHCSNRRKRQYRAVALIPIVVLVLVVVATVVEHGSLTPALLVVVVMTMMSRSHTRSEVCNPLFRSYRVLCSQSIVASVLTLRF